MSDSRQDVATLVGDLARTVEELQSELEPDERPPLRPPTPRELTRFTSEVTIPAIVLVLETNVQALKLLQRTLRLATGEAGDGTASDARERAGEIGRKTLSQLDAAFADLQEALEGRPPDDRARELLDDARSIRGEIDDQLAASAGDGRRRDQGREPVPDRKQVDIDVESELQSIKDDVDDGDRSDDQE